MTRFAALLMAGLLVTGPAWAHAGLLASDPKDESVLAETPREVVLQFSEKVELNFSSVQITDVTGKRVDAAKLLPDANHPTWVHVPLAGPALGRCELNWRMVSVDSHVTKGNIAFTIR